MIDVQCDCYTNEIVQVLFSLAKENGWVQTGVINYSGGTIFCLIYASNDKGYYSLYNLSPIAQTLDLDKMIKLIKKGPPK